MEIGRKVFISYARENEEFCTRLAQALKSKGYSVWIDIEAIGAGANWASNIFEALQNAEFVIAVHSSAALNRSYQAKGEWMHALDLGKRILPIIVEGGIRPHKMLAHIQAIDFSIPGTFDENIEKINFTLSEKGETSVSNSQTPFSFDYTERLSLYPTFSDGLAKNYSELVNHASTIDCMAGIGHRFFVQHDSALMRRLVGGAQLRILLAKPNTANLRAIASWTSTPELDLEYLSQRLRNRAIQTAEAIERIAKYVPSSNICLKVMECASSFTTYQFDVSSNNGTIVVTLYPLGPSVHPFLRPSTLLNQNIFPDLYMHFCMAFEFAWEHAEVITTEQFAGIASIA